MQVNHDPEGIVSFHPDGSPVHTTLTLSFKEIELVTSEDAVDAKLDTTPVSYTHLTLPTKA